MPARCILIPNQSNILVHSRNIRSVHFWDINRSLKGGNFTFFSIKQIKCVATRSLMEAHLYSTSYLGNPTNLGMFMQRQPSYRSWQHTGKIRSTRCSALAEKKRFGCRFRALCRTQLFMALVPAWDTLSGLIMNLAN